MTAAGRGADGGEREGAEAEIVKTAHDDEPDDNN